MLRCHADCPLPPPSPPCFLSSPAHLSPLHHACLNLLKRRCGLTVVISHHATTALCVTSAQYTSDRSVYGGHYESQHLGGRQTADHPGTCRYTVMFYTRPMGGSRCYGHRLAKPSTLPPCIAGESVSGPLA